MGWRGINVDARPGSMRLFTKLRGEDINLELAVSNTRTNLRYYQFAETALNTFCQDLAVAYEKQGYPIIATQEIMTVTLGDILNKHLAPSREIDFLSIDVEGLDLEVLKSNDWEKYRPRIVLVEDLNVRNLHNLGDSATSAYLLNRGYRFAAKTFNTMFFARN
jgi:FkbM family methyltransferase